MNKLCISLIILGFLVGCGAKKASQETTMEDVKVQPVVVTSAPTLEPSATAEPTPTAEPTFSPEPAPTERPTSTPDPQAEFEQCMESVEGVRYVITGEGVEQALVGWEDDAASSHQGKLSIPLCMNFTDFEQGDILVVSARLISPDSDAKRISCQIFDGESELVREDIQKTPLWTYCTARAK